ncbi:hypothetical protein [Halobellus salinus]|nr:hypothetical protein [Halobellus salinus]
MQAAIEILMTAAAYEEKIEETDTVGYSRVTYFETPGCRKSSRSYSRQYEKAINATEEKKERGDDLGRPRFGMAHDEERRRQVPGKRWEDVMEIFEMREGGHTYKEITEEVGVRR